MANPTGRISLKLTPEQSAIVQKATGKRAEALELAVTELEERVAPSTFSIIKSTDVASPKL